MIKLENGANKKIGGYEMTGKEFNQNVSLGTLGMFGIALPFFFPVQIAGFPHLGNIILLLSIMFVLMGYGTILYQYLSKQKRYSRKELKAIDEMSDKEIQEYVVSLLAELDYHEIAISLLEVKYGSDILCSKDGTRMLFYPVQSRERLGVDVIEEAVRIRKSFAPERTVIMTNHFYTAEAREQAERVGVTLWNRQDISKILERLYKEQNKKTTES